LEEEKNKGEKSMEDTFDDIKKVELKLDISGFFMVAMRVILSLLIIVLLMAMAGSLVKIAMDFPHYMSQEIEIALKKMLIRVLMLLAMVEIFKTTMVYFSEGRVKVTFIVDTILIVILTESMSAWFSGTNINGIFALIALIIVLVITRIVAVRYSPNERG
jgi:uncharacterized membrane protein (DUF373 family)